MRDSDILANALARARRWLRRGARAGRTAEPAAPSALRAVGIWLVDQCGAVRPSEVRAPAPPSAHLRRRVLEGLHTPARPLTGPFPAPDPWELLRPDPEAPLAAAEHVSTGTAFGTRTGGTAEEVERWALVLRSGLVAAARFRDVEVMAALVRASAFLGRAEHSVVTSAAVDLAAQQRADGGFGGQPRAGSSADPDGIRLPLTVSCAWSLAELARPGLTATAVRADHTRAPSAGMEREGADGVSGIESPGNKERAGAHHESGGVRG